MENTIILYLIIRLVINLLFRDPLTQAVLSGLILYVKTRDIKAAILVPGILWVLSEILLRLHEPFCNAPSVTSSGIVIPAATRQSVLFSESDDPDRPDHIDENPPESG